MSFDAGVTISTSQDSELGDKYEKSDWRKQKTRKIAPGLKLELEFYEIERNEL